LNSFGSINLLHVSTQSLSLDGKMEETLSLFKSYSKSDFAKFEEFKKEITTKWQEAMDIQLTWDSHVEQLRKLKQEFEDCEKKSNATKCRQVYVGSWLWKETFVEEQAKTE